MAYVAPASGDPAMSSAEPERKGSELARSDTQWISNGGTEARQLRFPKGHERQQ